MVYICVICMATQARLWTLNNEHRKLLLAILSPAMRPDDWDRLKSILLLACSECLKMVQSVLGFQGTALAGVNHLLSLLPSVEARQENEDASNPLSLLKDEKLEDSLLEIDSYMEMQFDTETKPLTQDVKLESASEGAAAADSQTAAVEAKTEDNTLNNEVVSETTSVADQNKQNSSTQATPVTRCDTRIATFTHGPVRLTPRGNVVYDSMLPNNPGHGSMLPNNQGYGSVLPNNPEHGSMLSNNPGHGSMLPNNPGRCSMLSNNPGHGSMLPNNPGHGLMLPNNLGRCSMLSNNPGHGSMLPNNPGHGSMLPNNPGRCSMLSNNPGHGSMLPNNPGRGSMLPNNPGRGSMLPNNPGHGSMVLNNPGHGLVPSGNVVCGSNPTNYLQNYQMNPVTSPMTQHEIPQGPVVSQSTAHYQMYNQGMCPSQLRPVNVPVYFNGAPVGPMGGPGGWPGGPGGWPGRFGLVPPALNGLAHQQTTLPSFVPLTHQPANMAPITSVPYLFNGTTGQNMPINQLNPNLATSANRKGTKLARRAQVNGVTSVPSALITIDVDGNGQTDKQEISQPKTGPWYVQFLSEAEILVEREAARSEPKFAEASHKCDACLVVFNSYDDKDAHDRSVHMCSEGGYSCGICGYSSDNANDLRAHASRHSTRFCCSYCQFRTPDESVIRRHYCTNMPQHRKPKATKNRFRKHPGDHKCNECGGRFQQEFLLQAHMERLHSTPSGPITCEVCKKELKNTFKYKIHMRRHKKQEERERGEGQRPELFCGDCVVEFECKTAYENHMMTLKHCTKENWQFECDICKKKFPSKSRVAAHITNSHLRPIVQGRYKCEQCPREYRSQQGLRRHRLSHAPADAADRRPHVCHLCAKAFTIQKSLREHLLMHEGKRPHACPLCPATFTYSAALYTHNRLKHLKIKRNIKKKPKNKKTKKDAAKSTD